MILDAASLQSVSGSSLTITGSGDDIVFTVGDLSASLTVSGAVTKAVITEDADATSADDSIVGTAGQDAIKSGSGDDSIDGGAGADIIYAGAGSDTVVFDGDDLRVFGGAGIDTLVITQQDTVDGGASSTLNRLNTSAGDVDFTANTPNIVDGFEVLDLRGNGKQTILLDANAVLAMSDSGKVSVKGDFDDVVKLYGGWTSAGVESDLDGNIYNVFVRDQATVAVSERSTVSIVNELGGSIIMGTSGSDDTTINSAYDGASAGDGDDIIRIETMQFTSADGGRGYDKVYFELNSNSTINTALLSSTSLTNIEEIDLREDTTSVPDDKYTTSPIQGPTSACGSLPPRGTARGSGTSTRPEA